MDITKLSWLFIEFFELLIKTDSEQNVTSTVTPTTSIIQMIERNGTLVYQPNTTLTNVTSMSNITLSTKQSPCSNTTDTTLPESNSTVTTEMTIESAENKTITWSAFNSTTETISITENKTITPEQRSTSPDASTSENISTSTHTESTSVGTSTNTESTNATSSTSLGITVEPNTTSSSTETTVTSSSTEGLATSPSTSPSPPTSSSSSTSLPSSSAPSSSSTSSPSSPSSPSPSSPSPSSSSSITSSTTSLSSTDSTIFQSTSSSSTTTPKTSTKSTKKLSSLALPTWSHSNSSQAFTTIPLTSPINNVVINIVYDEPITNENNTIRLKSSSSKEIVNKVVEYGRKVVPNISKDNVTLKVESNSHLTIVVKINVKNALKRTVSLADQLRRELVAQFGRNALTIYFANGDSRKLGKLATNPRELPDSGKAIDYLPYAIIWSVSFILVVLVLMLYFLDKGDHISIPFTNPHPTAIIAQKEAKPARSVKSNLATVEDEVFSHVHSTVFGSAGSVSSR